MDGLYQCSQCGHVGRVKVKGQQDDGAVYVDLWCDICKQVTRQLYCGEEEKDFYLLYDVVMDSRFYTYNTK